MTTITIQILENTCIKKEKTFEFSCLPNAIEALKALIATEENLTGKKHWFNQPKRCWDVAKCIGDGTRFILNAELEHIFKANEFINQ